jgi:hypothetical protein
MGIRPGILGESKKHLTMAKARSCNAAVRIGGEKDAHSVTMQSTTGDASNSRSNQLAICVLVHPPYSPISACVKVRICISIWQILASWSK